MLDSLLASAKKKIPHGIHFSFLFSIQIQYKYLFTHADSMPVLILKKHSVYTVIEKDHHFPEW